MSEHDNTDTEAMCDCNIKCVDCGCDKGCQQLDGKCPWCYN